MQPDFRRPVELPPIWEEARIAIRERDQTRLRSLEIEISQARLSRPLKSALQARVECALGGSRRASRLLFAAARERRFEPVERMVLGEILLELGDLPAAAAHLRAAQDAGFSEPGLQTALGIVELRLGRTENGVANLERALAADDRQWPALYFVALGFAALQQGQAALAALERLVEIRPDFVPGWVGLAEHSIALGFAARAAERLRPVVEAHPNEPRLSAALAKCNATQE